MMNNKTTFKGGVTIMDNGKTFIVYTDNNKMLQFQLLDKTTVVTGSFGNYIFNKLLDPRKEFGLSDDYLVSILEENSLQKGRIFDSEGLQIELRKWYEETDKYLIDNNEMNVLYDFYNGLALCSSPEEYLEILNKECPDFVDLSIVPPAYLINPNLKVVFDAFNYMCEKL